MKEIYTVQLGDWLGKKFRIIHSEAGEILYDTINPGVKNTKGTYHLYLQLKHNNVPLDDIAYEWTRTDEANPMPRFVSDYNLNINVGFWTTLLCGPFAITPTLTEDGIMRKALEDFDKRKVEEETKKKNYVDMPFGRVYH
ncbi:MAG: hypothetical protein MJ106_07040 [Lentisphaeria bacterium]|nr:hypothetical protein [Lentisphaeria bacterium]